MIPSTGGMAGPPTADRGTRLTPQNTTTQALCQCHGAPVGDGATICREGTDELRSLLRWLTADISRTDREPKRITVERTRRTNGHTHTELDVVIAPGHAGRMPSTIWDTPSGEMRNLPRMLDEQAAKLAVRVSHARLKALHAEPPLPLDLRAVDDAGRIRETIGRWASATSGRTVPLDAAWSVTTVADWLIDELPTIRQQDWAGQMLTEIRRLIERVERHIDTLPARRYLGVCGITSWRPAEGTEGPSGPTCTGQVFAIESAPRGRCNTCKAEHDVAQRQADREEQLRGVRLTAVEIERITADFGRRIPRTSINRWAENNRITGDGAVPPRFRYDEVVRVAADVANAAAARAARKASRRGIA